MELAVNIQLPQSTIRPFEPYGMPSLIKPINGLNHNLDAVFQYIEKGNIYSPTIRGIPASIEYYLRRKGAYNVKISCLKRNYEIPPSALFSITYQMIHDDSYHQYKKLLIEHPTP